MKALSRRWLLRAIPIAALAVVAVAVLASLFVASSSPKSTVNYKGKSLDVWFYGARTNFFSAQARVARRQALEGVGTNAFPFLLSKLQRPGGNGAIYCMLYSKLPGWIQARLPGALWPDDIRDTVLWDIGEIGRLRPDQVQALADCVPGLGNRQVRMSGLDTIRRRYQAHPAFLELCRKLLDDKHPGVQLEAAIYVGNSALASDPHEPRLFPILLAGFESKELRKATLDVENYIYRHWAPFRPVPRPAVLPPYYGAINQDQILQGRIEDALLRLKPYLTEEQRERLGRADEMQRKEKLGRR